MTNKKKVSIGLGFIFSIILCVVIYILNMKSIKANSLVDLAFYYQSMGNDDLYFKLLNGYSFFNSIFIFLTLLLIPLFQLINHYLIKSKVFLNQFILVFIIFAWVIYYKEIFGDRIWIENLFPIGITLFIIYHVVKPIVHVFQQKENRLYQGLSSFTIIYYLLLIIGYFIMILWLQDLAVILKLILFMLSLVLTIVIPLIIQERELFNDNTFKVYKPVLLLLLIVVTILTVKSTVEYRKYSRYYSHLPNQLVLDEKTFFYKLDDEINKRNCEVDTDHLVCSVDNDSGILNNYYFDKATIRLSDQNSESLNATDLEIRIFYSYWNDVLAMKLGQNTINDFEVLNQDEETSITIPLNAYLNKYKLKNYTDFTIQFYIYDKNTEEKIPLDSIEYEVILMKYES